MKRAENSGLVGHDFYSPNKQNKTKQIFGLGSYES